MWKKTEEMAKRHEQGGSLWLKLASDGDKAIVVFLGEPHLREVCFVDGKYVEVDDALKAQGLKSSLRVSLNVALFDSKEVKVLEQGVVFFKDLVRVRDKSGLEKWAFELQRHGAAKDPKTTYSILPKHKLSAEQHKAFNGAPFRSPSPPQRGRGRPHRDAARHVATRASRATRRGERRCGSSLSSALSSSRERAVIQTLCGQDARANHGDTMMNTRARDDARELGDVPSQLAALHTMSVVACASVPGVGRRAA
jgi:hypothetical protein